MRQDVAIIVPTHNSSETLRECLKSALSQSCSCEVIVADNFSSDDTINIAKQMGASIITNCGIPENRSSAKNVGIKNSSAKYVLLLDSDELLEVNTVLECVTICEKEKSVQMIKIPLRFVGTNFWGACSAFWKNCHYVVGKRTIGSVPRFFVRNLLLEVGLFDENLVIGEDWELYTRLKKMGLGETYCKSSMSHLELSSVKRILLKEVGYSRFAPELSKQIRMGQTSLLRNSLSAFSEAIRAFRKSPKLVVGCFILLFLKGYIWTIRFVTLSYYSPR